MTNLYEDPIWPILLYVPASYTSMLRPLNVALNSVLKHHMTSFFGLGWLWSQEAI